MVTNSLKSLLKGPVQMGQTTSCVDQETRDPKNDTEGTVLKVS